MAPEGPFTIGDKRIDPTKQTLTGPAGEVALSFHEVELLRLLVANAGQPVTRDAIFAEVWGQEASPTNRTVDNVIVKLRKKLEPAPDKPRHILTVYGVGYKLCPERARRLNWEGSRPTLRGAWAPDPSPSSGTSPAC